MQGLQMLTQTLKVIIGALILGFMSGKVWAASNALESPLIQRDRTYEQNLRWEASDDQTITPSRVIRWLQGARGAAVFATVSPAEFQPIVNVYNSRVRAVATIAYKF
jgi:hypothetical protein